MQKLHRYLAKNGIDQQTFAVMVETTPATVCRMLRGTFPPKLRIAQNIERITKGQVKCMDWDTSKDD